MITIRKATIDDIGSLSNLFDAYRVFYKQPSDPDSAITFLRNRMERNESTIFVAEEDGQLYGFTQLYPTFSSVSLEKYYILNDLYVLPLMRGKGVGKSILNHCQKWAKSHGFKGLSLETASDNPAQQLYEREGWSRDEDFYHYFWSRPKG